MLEITVSLLLLALGAVGLLEYFRVWRPRALAAADELQRTAVGARKVGESAGAVAEAAKKRLIRWLEGAATRAEERLQQLERSIGQVQATQALHFVQAHSRALETLRRFEAAPDDSLLLSARSDLRNGFADLGLYLSTASGELLLQHHEASLVILEHAAEAAQLELAVLAALDRRAEMPMALVAHRRLADRWCGKLQDLGDLSQRLLPPPVRQGCGGKPGQARHQQLELIDQRFAVTALEAGAGLQYLAATAEA